MNLNAANSTNIIPVEYALQYIPDRPALHKALLRNQLWVPPFKDSICTKDFLVGILEKRYWVPMTSELQIRNCADLPNKKELATMLRDQMAEVSHSVEAEMKPAFLNTAEMVLRHPPSQSWTVAMISTINQSHAIFSKDWQKPKMIASSHNITHSLVPAFADFF